MTVPTQTPAAPPAETAREHCPAAPYQGPVLTSLGRWEAVTLAISLPLGPGSFAPLGWLRGDA